MMPIKTLLLNHSGSPSGCLPFLTLSQGRCALGCCNFKPLGLFGTLHDIKITNAHGERVITRLLNHREQYLLSHIGQNH